MILLGFLLVIKVDIYTKMSYYISIVRYKEMQKMELVKHIEAKNAKMQKWIDEDPKNRFGGMLVTDPAHWAEYEIYTPAQLDRYLDGESLYETISYCTSKSYARSVIADLSDVSDEEFQKEVDYWSKQADIQFKEEKEAEKARVEEFEKRVTDTINAGAGDRATAIRWIVQAENMENEHDAGYICYCLNLPYSYEKDFQPLIKRVA